VDFNYTLPLHRNSLAIPDEPALWVDSIELTYAELAARARTVASFLAAHSAGRPLRVGILGTRSLEALCGLLGTGWTGGAYVPVGLFAPEQRIMTILDLVGMDAVIADRRGVQLLTDKVLAACPGLVLVPDGEAVRRIGPRPGLDIRAMDALSESSSVDAPAPMGPEDVAYIEFTSGTTGVPKGVMVSAGGLHHYVTTVQRRYHIGHDDRAAETIDLSFDLSAHNMFTAWEGGACLHVVPQSQQLNIVKYINDHQITTWLNVPSTIALAKRLRMLQPGCLPSLRLSMFCGEPLPAVAALSWAAAAPNSLVDNLYGPTEATCACLWQEVTDPPVVTPRRGVIAIGRPFPGMEAAIVGPDLGFLPPGEEGELALSGVQLALGYLNAPEITAARFPVIDGKRWYLTGDLAVQDADGTFHHLGRIDNQVKVRGIRIELEEIETHLRAAAGTDMAAAVAWPVENGSADGIMGFVTGTEMEPAEIREELKKLLPTEMMPTSIRCLAEMPLTANGKIDRKAIIAMLEAERAHPRQPQAAAAG
jgi:amino acid adenylation domain-containing protein